MPLELNRLLHLGFAITSGTINRNNQGLQYNFAADDDPQILLPGVYLIVVASRSANELDVIYVGKAGRGLNTRLGQHAAGYERKRQSNAEIAANSLERRMIDLDRFLAEIWYRPSVCCEVNELFNLTVKPPRFVSRYSLDEEALIVYFKGLNEPLANFAMPPLVEGGPPNYAFDDDVHTYPDCLNLITAQIEKNSPEFADAWNSAIGVWDQETISNFCSALEQLSCSPVLMNRVPKIIGRYTSGPFRGEKVLVFGELVNVNFSPGSNQLIFTLDGKYISLYPFEQGRMIVLCVSDFVT
jgi:hypothetical protein